MALPTREELLKRVRQKNLEKASGRRDPDEFRCPQIKSKSETLEYYFIVLPELQIGEACKGGVCEVGSELWYYENGSHFIDNNKYECPRVHDGSACPMCEMGFELIKDTDDRDVRKNIASRYIARGRFAVNVYFLNVTKNPEDLRGKVKWYNMPNTVWDKMDACVSSDDPGDEIDQKACGIFYHPWEGCYTFKLIARKKGDYNTYEESCFLPKTFGPLAALKDEEGKIVKDEDGNSSPDEERITEILAQRHVLQKKFTARDEEKLSNLVAKIQAKELGHDEAEQIPVDEPKEEPQAEEVSEETVTEETASEEAEVEKPKASSKKKPAPAEEDELVEETPAPAKPPEKKAKPPAKSTKPAKPAKTAAKAIADDDDPELQSLLGAIKKS